MGKADPDGGVSARRSGSDNRNAHPRLIQNQSAVQKIAPVIEVSRTAASTHSPALPVMFYVTRGVKLHEKGAHGGHSADLSLASPHATGTKRKAG